MRVAILGATGHVAKNLIDGMTPAFDIVAFSRSEDLSSPVHIGAFHSSPLMPFYDAVINCIGAGTPEKVKAAGPGIFATTERFDDLIIEYIQSHPGSSYINISSGIVHVEGKPDAYRMTKLNAEAKHRAFADLPICDLRLFSFFSRHVDTSSSHMMAEISRAVVNGTEFVTTDSDIQRDYVSPVDLCQVVAAAIRTGVNCACDIYSAAPTTKRAIIVAMQERFGLRVEYVPSGRPPSASGDSYIPLDRSANEIFGYAPTMTSLETIQAELKAMGLA
jgi:hypothetical protein